MTKRVIKKHGDNFIITTKGKNAERQVVKKITSRQARGYSLIGTCWGMTWGHCFFLAHIHSKNFLKRVCAYRVLRLLRKDRGLFRKNRVKAAFYEKREAV